MLYFTNSVVARHVGVKRLSTTGCRWRSACRGAPRLPPGVGSASSSGSTRRGNLPAVRQIRAARPRNAWESALRADADQPTSSRSAPIG